MLGDLSKWRADFRKFKEWNSKKHRNVQGKEAKIIISWLLDMKLDEYSIVEIGCGNGYLGKLIIEEFLKRDIKFIYHFTDLVPECIDLAKETVKNLNANVKFSIIDVFQADKFIFKESQNVIISTGYASAATYKQAIAVVAPLLCEGGVLIADFVNHLSLPIIINEPWRSVKKFINFTQNEGKNYHFGILGLKKFFSQFSLVLEKQSTIRWRRNPLICLFRKTNDAK